MKAILQKNLWIQRGRRPKTIESDLKEKVTTQLIFNFRRELQLCHCILFYIKDVWIIVIYQYSFPSQTKVCRQQVEKKTEALVYTAARLKCKINRCFGPQNHVQQSIHHPPYFTRCIICSIGTHQAYLVHKFHYSTQKKYKQLYYQKKLTSENLKNLVILDNLYFSPANNPSNCKKPPFFRLVLCG